MSKLSLMIAFLRGEPITVYPSLRPSVPPIHFTVLNRVEREDGSNRRYNLTGITQSGETATCFCITLD